VFHIPVEAVEVLEALDLLIIQLTQIMEAQMEDLVFKLQLLDQHQQQLVLVH
jgi:hypothetical protein